MTDVREYKLDSDFFISNRQRFEEKLGDNTVAFLYASDEVAISPDSDSDFYPDHNFYYLTGLSNPGQILVVVKRNSEISETIYAKPHDDYEERWHGKRQDFSEISSISGISDVRSLDDYSEDSLKLIKDNSLLIALDGGASGKSIREFRDSLSSIRMNEDVIDIKDILTRLRMVKSEPEIEAIRVAARATEEAIAAVRDMLVPGNSEYDIRNAFEYELMKRGSRRPAFTTIVSAGTNAFYLHHGVGEDCGEGIIKQGGQVQFDVGARCCEYCSDISRVFYIGTPDEKKLKLIELIQKLRREAFAFLRAGVTLSELNNLMRRITGEWLAVNGLVPEEYSDADVGRYYWHNTSHHLGLDTHDVSFRQEKLTAGNCLAVEPGVYIKEWGIGFRIEDDVLITDDGCELLSSGNDDIEGIVIL